MMSELVSVVVPVYNCEKYLERCLSSIFAQTYKNIDVICINDGSTDNSLEICEIWAKKFSFIKDVLKNNFEVSTKRSRRKVIVSPVNFFSTYNTKGHLADPKVQINIINEKLDNLTKSMLETQVNNLKILQQVDEIKGLIVDLMSS